MSVRESRQTRTKQSGFSMVEMLMTAFILAIGILGITMLQVMSMRAAGGSRNLGIAVQLAEQVMDEVELEGRTTYLNANNTNYTTPGSLVGMQYINQTAKNEYFKLDATSGQAVAASASDALFTVTMSQEVAATVNGQSTGLSDVQVQVTFFDVVNPSTHKLIPRTVTIARRILHG